MFFGAIKTNSSFRLSFEIADVSCFILFFLFYCLSIKIYLILCLVLCFFFNKIPKFEHEKCILVSRIFLCASVILKSPLLGTVKYHKFRTKLVLLG